MESHNVKLPHRLRSVADNFLFEWWNSVEKELQDMLNCQRGLVRVMLCAYMMIGHTVAASDAGTAAK